MRDDRYRGTSLPQPVRKLCRMAERDADRARPERLSEQADRALVFERKDISSEFRQRLREHDVAPGLFDARDLGNLARTGLEAEIARGVMQGRCSTDAVSEALRERGKGYLREQKCRLIADRHPHASAASECVSRAFDEAAPIAASTILEGQRIPQTSDRVHLSEDLLLPADGRGRP